MAGLQRAPVAVEQFRPPTGQKDSIVVRIVEWGRRRVRSQRPVAAATRTLPPIFADQVDQRGLEIIAKPSALRVRAMKVAAQKPNRELLAQLGGGVFVFDHA